MATVAVPEEAAIHLGALLWAFNREIFGTLLDEADELAKLGQAASAVIIAGTVLEYFERSPSASALPLEHRSKIAAWRQLRNQVAHGSAGALSVQQARQVIDGVRQMFLTHNVLGGPANHFRVEAAATPQVIKGKYSHVPTSSDDFIQGKREDLELEDCG